nr:hypothetical protein [Pseudomonadales bacterium]
MNLGNLLNGPADKVALVDLSDAGRSYTYEELATAIQEQEIDVEPGAQIGLLGANSAAFVVTFSTIMARGGVAVPIN